jgi:hypothetical protein
MTKTERVQAGNAEHCFCGSITDGQALGIASLVVTLITAVAGPGEVSALLELLAGLLAGVGFIFAMISWRVVPLALCASAGIAAGIVLPAVTRACCGSNEASAVGALHAIISGQAAYEYSCAHGGFAVDLADLARAPSAGGQGFISPDLNVNGVVKSGYFIALARDAAASVTDVGAAADTCNQSVHPPATSYFASANPTQVGVTTLRYFATDKSGAIVFSTKGPVLNPIRLGPDVQLLR